MGLWILRKELGKSFGFFKTQEKDIILGPCSIQRTEKSRNIEIQMVNYDVLSRIG
jgi:hypothetical protein